MKRLQPGSPGLTVCIGLLSGLGPMSTDMYLVSLPAMADYFGSSVGEIQSTLTAYLFGFAIGQVIYGPISDRTGRRIVLAWALVLYCAVSLVSVLLPTVEWLIAARFVQALTAAAPIVIGRAIIRDIYSGSEIGRQLAIVIGVIGFTPMVAPLVGSILQSLFGWQSIFITFAIIGMVSFLTVRFALPETLQHRIREGLSPAAITRGFGDILANPVFRPNVAMVGFSYGGMFAYFVGSTFVLQGEYGFTELQYGLAFGAMAVVFLIASFVGARLGQRLPSENILAAGVGLLALGGVGVLLGALLDSGQSAAFLVPIAVYMVGIGFAMPRVTGAALAPFARTAGTASSLIGFIQSGSAALVVLATSVVAAGSAEAVGIVMALLGVGTLLVFLASRRIRTLA